MRGVTEKVAPDRGETTRRRSPAGGESGETLKREAQGRISRSLGAVWCVDAHVVSGDNASIVAKPVDLRPQVFAADGTASRGFNRSASLARHAVLQPLGYARR